MFQGSPRNGALVADQLLDRIYNVADGSNGLELVRPDSLFGHFLQPDNQIDRVNAVKIEVFVQSRLKRYLLF